MHLTGGHFLDVGCGTGKPLKAIINHLKKYFEKIVGVDLDSAYTEKAIKQFENDENV
jgi:ubiquinone/menaquinone biosynthesis C-methylase UbiE